MGIKASEVGDWLRQRAGKRDHREIIPDDYLVLRPGPNHLSSVSEIAMGMKASEVSDWLRQRAGKRDHREAMPGDYLVLRPGPNFGWLMGNPPAGQPPPPAPEPDPAGDDHRDADGVG